MGHLPPRVPLHLQDTEIAKAFKPKNPSYESFRPNIMHESHYEEMSAHANEGMSTAYRLRRYPNGDLDIPWTGNQVIDAIHKIRHNGLLLPIEEALLTVIFPAKVRLMEPQLAEIRTQLSGTERDQIRLYVSQHIAEEANWNTGRGGGNTLAEPDGVP